MKMDYKKPSGIGVIYARYSSHNQKDVSIEQQVTECEDYAKANNLEILEIYADRHLTGKTDKRPEYQRMLRNAEKGKFQYIIAYKSNRVARNMMHALMFEEKLSKMGVKILYAKEEFGDNAAGRFALRSMMNVNQFYSENMSEDILRGMRDNALECKVNNGGLPLGYCKGPDGKYAIVADEAELVQDVFEMVAEGVPFIDIANDFNARGIKTSKGNAWNKGSFHRMVTNERYIGIYKFGDIKIPDGIPPIISKELFYRVQNRITTKSNPQGRQRENGSYLLTGKLYCGHCGSHMVGISGTGNTGEKYYYYVCQGRRLEKTCEKIPVQRDWLELRVAEITKDYILASNTIDIIAKNACEYLKKAGKNTLLHSLEAQLGNVRKSIKNIVSAMEQGIFTSSTKDRLLELEAEQAKLEKRITLEGSEKKVYTADEMRAWLNNFCSGDPNDKKYQEKIIDSLVNAIYLYDDSIKIVYNNGGKRKTATFNFIEGLDKGDSPDKVRISSPRAHHNSSKKSTKSGLFSIL